MRILDQAAVDRLASIGECIELIDAAMREVARGAFELPPRRMLGPLAQAAFGVMAGASRSSNRFGAKLITIRSAQVEPYASHQGVVVLFDAASGIPTALLEAGSVTAVRTAAASAVATRALSRPDSEVLALLGSGQQAHTHLAAMRAVRPIRRCVVWSRTREHAVRFESAYPQLDIVVVDDVEAAVACADIVCTLTASTTPILRGAWLKPGQHINAVGAGTAGQCELDAEAVRRARFYADYAEFVRVQGGEYLDARARGVIDDAHLLGNVGDVLDGAIPGRLSADDITVYKSLGLVAQDMAYAEYLVRKAAETGVGMEIDFAAEHHA